MVPYRTYKRLLYTCSIQIPATHTHTHRQLSTGESVRDSSIIENCLATSPRLSFLQQSSCAIFSNIIIFFDRGRKMSSFPVSVRSPPPSTLFLPPLPLHPTAAGTHVTANQKWSLNALAPSASFEFIAHLDLMDFSSPTPHLHCS